jgi:uncharacterized protein (DUF1778 family)
MKTPKTKPISGGAKIKADGNKPVLLGITPGEHEFIKAAAAQDRRSMSSLIILGAVKEAERILGRTL